ncbi:hypothetical protein WAI453_013345 [Rhynchosporium graminicola]
MTDPARDLLNWHRNSNFKVIRLSPQMQNTGRTASHRQYSLCFTALEQTEDIGYGADRPLLIRHDCCSPEKDSKKFFR